MELEILPVSGTLLETQEKLKKAYSGAKRLQEYAFVRGGGKSVDGVVEGCTPRNGKNKMLRYVFGE